MSPSKPRPTLHEQIDEAIAANHHVRVQLLQIKNRITETISDESFATGALVLPPSCRGLLGLLMARDSVTVEGMIVALWGGLPDADVPLDPPRAIRVFIHDLRSRLHAVDPELVKELTCITGSKFGESRYSLTAKGKKRVRELTMPPGGLSAS